MRAITAIGLVLLSVSTAAAQAPPAKKDSLGVPKEPKLAFDREVFNYPGDSRKDPFRPLVGTDAIGPLFEDLTLRGIIYSRDPKMSIATFVDGSRPPRVYKRRIGEVVGNARIAAINPREVTLLVQSYGVIREEKMQLATRSVASRDELNAEQTGRALGELFGQELMRALTGQQRPTVPGATTTPGTTARPGPTTPSTRPQAAPRGRADTTSRAPTNRTPIRRNEER